MVLEQPELFVIANTICCSVLAVPSCLLELLLSHGLGRRHPRMLSRCLYYVSSSQNSSVRMMKRLRPASLGKPLLDLSFPEPAARIITKGQSFLASIAVLKLFPGFIGLIFTTIQALAQPRIIDLSSTDCYKNRPNPDIVGFGVRYSIYILLLFVFVSLYTASFYRQQSGTKELGCTIVLSKHST